MITVETVLYFMEAENDRESLKKELLPTVSFYLEQGKTAYGVLTICVEQDIQ